MSNFLFTPSDISPISQISAAVVGAIVGAIIGGYLAYFFGVRLQRKQEERRAGAAFISAFVEEVRKLESERIQPYPYDVFVGSISKHKEAAIYFRSFLRKRKRMRFDKDWDAYYGQPDDYQCGVDETEKIKNLTQLLLKRINRVLEYADQG